MDTYGQYLGQIKPQYNLTSKQPQRALEDILGRGRKENSKEQLMVLMMR